MLGKIRRTGEINLLSKVKISEICRVKGDRVPGEGREKERTALENRGKRVGGRRKREEIWGYMYN